MIALKTFSRRIGGSTLKVLEGKVISKSILDSYSKEEIQELKDKKIIGEPSNDSNTKKISKENK